MYQINDKNALRGLFDHNEKALTFCHNAARMDLEKPFHVWAITGSFFTEKKIAEYIHAFAPDMTDYVGVIFFERVRGTYRDLMAIHYAGMRFDGIMNHTFSLRAYVRGIDTFYSKTDMETLRKAFRKAGGVFYVVTQSRDLLRPASEFQEKTHFNVWHYTTPAEQKARRIVGDRKTDKSGYDRFAPVVDRIERADALRVERAMKAASEIDITQFRSETENAIRECRDLVADYILNYTHVSYERIPDALHTLIVLYEQFCSRERRNTFYSPDIKRRNMDEIIKCADRVKVLYAEWKAEQAEIA